MIKRVFQIIILLGSVIIGLFSVQAQVCGQWMVEVAVVDEKDKPVIGSMVEFEDVDEGDAANQVKFSPTDGDEHSFYVIFSEGQKSANTYHIVITAPGFLEKRVSISNYYCRSSQNRIALTSNGHPRTIFKDIRVLNGRAMTSQNRPAGIVYIWSQNGNGYRVFTDKNGFYTIRLKPGTYSINMNFASCDRFTSPDIVIGKKNVTYDFMINCEM